MIKQIEYCLYYAEKGLQVCMNHALEISLGTGIVLLYIIGPFYTLAAVFIWVIATALDMAIGIAKAEFVFDNYDSKVLGKSLVKRGIILSMGLVLLLLTWSILAFVNISGLDGLLGLVKWFSIIPIGYWHLFTIQELSSFMEHLEDVRPDNWMTRLWRRVKGKVEKRIDEKVDSVLKAWVNDMYNYLSPKFSKLHLNRDEQQM